MKEKPSCLGGIYSNLNLLNENDASIAALLPNQITVFNSPILLLCDVNKNLVVWCVYLEKYHSFFFI